MHHRHITATEWIPIAVESLFDRGEMADWQEFGIAMSLDTKLAKVALQLAAHHEDRGSAALARILVKRFHPEVLRGFDDDNLKNLRSPSGS